jgi:hypothetical protein
MIRPRLALAVVVALSVLGSFSRVMAGPPYVTDDPETPKRHGWEINLATTVARSSDMTQLQTPLFDVNFGLTSSVQLKLEMPVQSSHPAGLSWSTGAGDAAVGVKWRFMEEGKRKPQVAVYPQISLPTGDSARSLGAGEPSYLLPVLAQWSWDHWTWFGNAALVIPTASGSKTYGYWGSAVSRECSEQLSLGGEVFGSSATADGQRSDMAFNLGGEWIVSRGRGLLFSAGRSFRKGGDVLAYVGLQLQLGPAHRHHRRPPKAP